MLTIEIEHIDVDAIEAAAKLAGVDVEPTPSTIRVGGGDGGGGTSTFAGRGGCAAYPKHYQCGCEGGPCIKHRGGKVSRVGRYQGALSLHRQPLLPPPLCSSRLQLIQDKYVQKLHFADHGVPLPEFREIKCKGCMEAAGRDFGFPFMLKSKR